MSRYKACHAGAMPIGISPPIRCSVAGDIQARKDVAGKIRMIAVNAGVADGHDYSVALALGVRLGDVEVFEVPLPIADGIGGSGRHRHQESRDAARQSRQSLLCAVL